MTGRNKLTAKERTKKKLAKQRNGKKEEGRIIFEGWRDRWRNASVNPCESRGSVSGVCL